MKPPPPVAVAWFRGVEPVPVRGPAAVPWARLVDRLTDVPVYAAGLDKRAAPGWAPIVWKAGAELHRKAANVGALSALVADLDALPGGLDGLDRAAAELRGNAPRGPVACAWHTSWRSTEDEPRARLVIPFAEPCPASHWPAVWAAGARWLHAAAGLDLDPKCKDTGRWYLLPGLPKDAAPERWQGIGAASHPGAALDWRWLAAAYPEPPPPAPAPRPPERTRPDADWRSRDARRAAAWLDAAERAAENAAPGGRNSRLYGACKDAARMAAAGLIDDLPARLNALARAAERAGLSPAEVRSTVASGAADGAEVGGWTWPND